MQPTGADVLIEGMGPVFGLLFLWLTGMGIYQFLKVRDLAEAGRNAALEAIKPGNPGATRRRWLELGDLKSAQLAAAQRAELTCGSIPTLALLGTCLGFFYALVATGSLEVGSADPLAILRALMDAGVSTALATTVCGQGIYFLMGQIWSTCVAGPHQESITLLEEALALLRTRLAPLDTYAPPADPTDTPWPVSLASTGRIS